MNAQAGPPGHPSHLVPFHLPRAVLHAAVIGAILSSASPSVSIPNLMSHVGFPHLRTIALALAGGWQAAGSGLHVFALLHALATSSPAGGTVMVSASPGYANLERFCALVQGSGFYELGEQMEPLTGRLADWYRTTLQTKL